MTDVYTDIKYSYLYQDGAPRPQPSDFAAEYFKDKKNGVYIDVGANDGITWSNSLTFEINHNWKGICIEPHPGAFKKLQTNRKSINLNCAVSKSNEELDFMVIDGYAEMLSGLISTYDQQHTERIKREIATHGDKVSIVKILCKTLTTILNENNINHVDYLSVDTEGAETSVIESIDFNQHTYDLISLECNYDPTLMHEIMYSKGFVFLQKVCGDNFYKKV
jgi:FkbM family methyltransferase